MRVLVTGCDGFTGRHLKRELEVNGHVVIGLTANLNDYDAIAVEVKQAQPEAVIHLAGVAFVAQDRADEFYRVNLLGTHNLLSSLAEHVADVDAVLLASSANVYGNRSEGVLSESAVPDPVNDYAVSKLAMENMARLWMDRLPLFFVRPFNYTGVGQDNKFLIPKITSHFRDNKPVITLGNLDVARDFGDVRAVSQAYRKLIETCPAGQTINVCSGVAHTLREVIALCEGITGYQIEIRTSPEFVRENDVRMLIGDNNRLKQLIKDWQPIPLESTLGWMLSGTGRL